MTESQTKERITRNSIVQALWRTNAADIKAALFSFGYCAFFGTVIALILGFAVRQAHFPLILQILLVLVPFVPTVALLRLIYTVLTERKLLQAGAFDIIECPLSDKEEKYRRRYKRYEHVRYFYFDNFPPCEVGDTAYQLASVGDRYFLVLYRSKKPYVKLLYAAKMYDYREM